MPAYTIFISYAHEDEPFKNALAQQLKGLQRQGLIAPWDDRCIDGGDEWRRDIDRAIEGCHLALLLVSPAFIASDFIYAQELSRLLERRSREGIRVVPVIVKPCAWKHEKPIESLQARPKDAKAIITFPEETGARAQAWTDIVDEIAGWAKQRQRSPSTPSSSPAHAPAVVAEGAGSQPEFHGTPLLAATALAPAAAPASAGPPLPDTLEPQESKREPPMLLNRIPEPDARRGLQKIAGCDDDKRQIDIVFIHGLGGDAWTTWMADKDDIGTFWPNWLAGDLAGLGLWTLGYAAEGSKWKEESMPLADRGNQVLDLLSNEGLGERPLAFITHSMGGIVAKQILRHAESFGVDRWEAIAKQTKGVAFIATPHSGARVANFAELAAAVYRTNEHVEELAAHDPRLRELHGWFLKYQRESRVTCRTYCEKRELRPEIPLLGIKLPKGILVVDETSAEPNIPGERAVPLDEDHISICKPASRKAQLYKGVVRFLKDCLAAAASRPH